MRSIALLTCLFVLVGCETSESPTAELVDAPCVLSDLAIEGRSRSCHTLRVPERRRAPNDRTIGLHVEMWQPDDPTLAARPPIVFLNGGPGFSLIAYDGLGMLRSLVEHARRPVWLLEQRGNGLSDPALCPDVRGFQPTQAEQMACASALLAASIDAAAYNSEEAAADVVDLVRATDTERVVLWGHSYGSGLAQHVARQAPERIEALVLEGYATPTGPFDYPVEERFAVYGRFLAWRAARCAEEPACRAAYPEGVGDGIADATAVQALFMAQPGLQIPIDGDVALDGGRFERWVSSGLGSLYGMLLFAELTGAIAASSPEDDAPWRAWLARVGAGDEAAGRRRVADYLRGVDQAAVLWAVQTVRNCFDRRHSGSECEAFAGSPYGAGFSVPVGSEAPTLILQGDIDFQSNPRVAAQSLASFSRGALPALGECATHFVLLENAACIGPRVEAWLADPTQPFDTSCALARCEAVVPLSERATP